MTFRRLAIADGLHIACLDAGPLRQRRAPPLTLLHGIGADRAEWVLSLPLLMLHRRVLAFDLLGHGRSSKPDVAGVDFRIRLLTDTVVSAIEALPEPPASVDVLGHSLGGAVALDLASRYPRLVRRLVLVDAAGLPPTEALDPRAISLPFAPGSFQESRRLLRASVHSRLLNNVVMALGARLYKGRHRNRPQLLKLLASIAAGEDAMSAEDLARLTHETLILWGDRDRIFPLATGERLQQLLPNARLVVLPKCGHVAPAERPIAFARQVTGFLDAAPGR